MMSQAPSQRRRQDLDPLEGYSEASWGLIYTLLSLGSVLLSQRLPRYSRILSFYVLFNFSPT